MKQLIRSKLVRKYLWIAVFFIVIFVIWYFLIGISANKSGSFYNKNHNAVWIAHKWVGEKTSKKEKEDLVKGFIKNGIDTVFVHSGPLKEDGSIDPDTYRYALDFLEEVKKMNPDIEYQAWLGQIRGKIKLDDQKIRRNVTNQTVILTKMIGFDGIHMDIEPVWDKDVDFIQLLKEIDESIGEKKLSVALAEFIPKSVIWVAGYWKEFANYNTEENYRNVGKYADQIVVMTYDTSFEKKWLYRWFVKEQTIWTTRLFNKKENMEIFIGIPSYDEPTEAFNPDIENIENGLRGIIDGLNNLRSRERNFAGVAVYANWTTDENEWEQFYNLWIK